MSMDEQHSADIAKSGDFPAAAKPVAAQGVFSTCRGVQVSVLGLWSCAVGEIPADGPGRRWDSTGFKG